jgi:ketosteroid isomerase-like protein
MVVTHPVASPSGRCATTLGARQRAWLNNDMPFTKMRNRLALKMARRAMSMALVVASTAIVSAAQAPVESDQQVLIDLEQRWNEAFYRKDVAFIETILGDEFVATYDDGSQGDKAKELALATEFNQQVESAIPDGFTVKVYRDTAVVRFTLHLAGIRQGQRAELTLRYTDVWVIRDGRWQCVSTHSTRVTT